MTSQNSLLAPQPMTMDRLAQKDEILLAQSTSQCCRCCCFQNSINYVLAEQDNYEPGMNPFAIDSTGWIHEESSWCGRTWSWILPGCRAIKYVQHHGPAPASIMAENKGWFTCQTEPVTKNLYRRDRQSNVVVIHEKKCTCGYCFIFGDLTFPVCNCFPLPYLETKTPNGEVVGKTAYVCDACCFVPKYDVFKGGRKIYRIRPDTCVFGLCVRCRCTGKKGKCFRVPFIVRQPDTKEPLASGATRWSHAQIDNLWTGWGNECCTLRDAYHVAFPADATVEDKLLLTGAALVIDVTMFEQDN